MSDGMTPAEKVLAKCAFDPLVGNPERVHDKLFPIIESLLKMNEELVDALGGYGCHAGNCDLIVQSPIENPAQCTCRATTANKALAANQEQMERLADDNVYNEAMKSETWGAGE